MLINRDCDIVVTAAAHAQPQPSSCSINPHPTPPSEPVKHNQDNRREQWEGECVKANETGKNETGKHNQVAGEVEAAVGEHAPHIETPAEHHDKHNNEVGTHELVHVTTLAIELPPNDVALGEYNPPPPPPDPPPRNCPKQLMRNMAPVSTHPPGRAWVIEQ